MAKQNRAHASERGDRVGEIARALKDQIASGRYPPGARLPSEAELSTEFSASRATVREALSRLTAWGLLETRRGAQGGAFVQKLDLTRLSENLAPLLHMLAVQDHDPFALTSARIELEALCAAQAANDQSVSVQSGLAPLRSEIDKQSDFALSDAEFLDSCRHFHSQICALAQTHLLAFLASLLVEADFAAPRTAALRLAPRERARLLSSHMRIVSALAMSRPDEARAGFAELAAFEAERLGRGGHKISPLAPSSSEGAPKSAAAQKPRDLRLPRLSRSD